MYILKDTEYRKKAFAGVKKVVVKVGTRLLTDMGDSSKGDRIDELVAEIAKLRNDFGLEVLLVSSGAVGAGMTILGTQSRPADVAGLQAHAAVGQSRLLYHYEAACAKHGFHCGQLLLTALDLQDKNRHLNTANCLDALLAQNVLPIINENDSVSIEELRFGDNDMLAAMVATLLKADLTILLTTVNGMYNRDENGELGQRMSVVHKIDDEIKQMGKGTDGNKFSVGGMNTKLLAAEFALRAGEPLIIADGHDFSVLSDIFNCEDVGTLFVSSTSRLKKRKRFIAFFSEPTGKLYIDEGARSALENNSSLLPSGVTGVEGEFNRGDTVCIISGSGEEVARGVVNYNNREVELIKGLKSDKIGVTLSSTVYDEVIIHRDYLALTGNVE